MSDKWAKTHPWRCRVLQTYTNSLGTTYQPGAMFMARTRKELAETIAEVRAQHGHTVISDPFDKRKTLR